MASGQLPMAGPGAAGRRTGVFWRASASGMWRLYAGVILAPLGPARFVLAMFALAVACLASQAPAAAAELRKVRFGTNWLAQA